MWEGGKEVRLLVHKGPIAEEKDFFHAVLRKRSTQKREKHDWKKFVAESRGKRGT